MSVARTIYTVGSVTVSGFPLLAQSVNHSINTPKESVSAFGRTSVQRVASGPVTATADITFYPTGGEHVLFQALMTDSARVNPTRVAVLTTMGSLSNALLTSLKGDASIGSIPTISASFLGVNDTTSLTVTGVSTAITEIKTTESVSVSASGCAQKASFSWNMPVEPLLCLGTVISTGAEFFGNPPGSASISVEGTTDPGLATKVDLGHFAFALSSGADISSSTKNLAVGQLFGTYNTVSEGIAIDCTVAAS